MSVAAMTMDDQRPLVSNFDKMSKQYEQNFQSGAAGGAGTSAGAGAGASAGGGGGGGPLSGPASPTPSGSEESSTPQHGYHHQVAHHHHAHHHHHQHQHSHPHVLQQQQPQPQEYHHHHHPQQQQQQSSLTEQQHQTLQQTPLTPTLNAVNPSQAEQQQQQQQQQQSQQLPQQQQLHHQLPEPQQQQQQQQEQQSAAAAAVAAAVTEQAQTQQQSPLPTSLAETVAAAEKRQRLLEDEIESLKLEQTRVAQQCVDAQRREKILLRRLANKEQEFQDYISQIAEYKAAQAPSTQALRTALLDPAVNLLFEKLKRELRVTKSRLEETQNELSAWKFTPDSNTGKRLMAKCRLLYQENEELGKMTSNGRLAKLETELAMQKSFSEEVKKSQSELDDFLQELDEDVEGMQSTILFLQQELKTQRERIQCLEKENYQLKNGPGETVKEEDYKLQHVGLNGLTSTHVNDINAGYSHPLQMSALNLNVNDMKFQAATLETINENAYLQTTTLSAPPVVVPVVPNVGLAASEFFNGSMEPLPVTSTPGDEGSNSSSSQSAITSLRTAASRKRTYDSSDSNDNINVVAMSTVVVPPQVSMPRTLPPKKSKLRVTPVSVSVPVPVRRPSSSLDNNEIESTMLSSSNSSMGVASVVPSEPMLIMDNSLVGMASEENLTNMSTVMTVDDNGESQLSVAQRIMTRRRSVRLQQNGNGGGSSSSTGSGGGGSEPLY